MTGKLVNRGTGYGLEIPATYTWTGLKKAVACLENKINEEMKITEKLKNKCIIWNSQLLFLSCPLIRKEDLIENWI